MTRLIPLDPANYRRHSIHSDQRVWPETNCYSDVVIELLHGLGREPIAGLAFTLAIDFEGDQWTFFKFPHADLLSLYGFDIQELAVWRPLADHISDLIAAGRPVLVELDSYFLPDTAGTAYRRAHVKSTVAVNEIDVAGRRLGYFHNQGYYVLEGADFSDVFQVDGLVHERMLPPYFEYVKIRQGYTPPTGQSLLEKSLSTLAGHLQRVPVDNPFMRFQVGFRKDLEWLMNSNLETFHSYSFATLRQYGACYELSETYLRWLDLQGIDGLAAAADAFQLIAQGAKAFQFNLARSMARKRPLDLSPLDAMAEQWDTGMSLLRRRFT
jgi:Domain of unknown function (DUF1839)